MVDADIIKVDFMTKRSQGKSSFFKFDNYRSRWFVLRKLSLTYYESTNEGGRGKQKGEVQLSSVKVIEEVEQEYIDQKPNFFQIVYGMRKQSSSLGEENFTLYIQAVDDKRRQDWISALRQQCEACGCVPATRFHPGIWNSKRSAYSCCESIDKRDSGCHCVTWIINSNDSLEHNQVFSSTMINRPMPEIPRQATLSRTERDVRKVLAVYSYQKAEEGDLDLVKGDEYLLLDSSQENWWQVKDKTGDIGYIPSNYVQEVNNLGLEKYDWYYPGTSRTQSEEILKREEKEGWFLVRDSTTKDNYSLSIYTKERPEGRVRHYHIKTNATGEYYLSDQHSFPSIPDLIFYHKHNCAGLVCRLRYAPSKNKETQPPTAGFGHDKYEIDPSELLIGNVLGSGQYGTVKFGTWNKTIDVAIKMSKEGSMSEMDFIDEAKTMMELRHKNLVQLYGVCFKTRPIYIVTEYMKNGALVQYLRKHKQSLLQQPAKLLEMCAQVAEAMKYLESRQFIHRDLAARNCLVGESGVLKVGDFGLTRYVIDDTYTSSINSKFPIKWASPEVLHNARFSTKSDVWAYGVLMWEIWTGGEMPYSMIPNQDVVQRICIKRERLRQPGECPRAVYQVMLDCWAHQTEHRPTFVKVLEDINFLQDKDYD